jgi:hypothetical protein
MLYFKYRVLYNSITMKNTEHKQITPAVGTASKTADENGLSKTKTRDFPIVGIGASAGGLEAMELFLKHAAIFRYGVRCYSTSRSYSCGNFTGTIATQYCYGSTTGH